MMIFLFLAILVGILALVVLILSILSIEDSSLTFLWFILGLLSFVLGLIYFDDPAPSHSQALKDLRAQSFKIRDSDIFIHDPSVRLVEGNCVFRLPIRKINGVYHVVTPLAPAPNRTEGADQILTPKQTDKLAEVCA